LGRNGNFRVEESSAVRWKHHREERRGDEWKLRLWVSERLKVFLGIFRRFPDKLFDYSCLTILKVEILNPNSSSIPQTTPQRRVDQVR
jgi:hypothetical protein